ncbi:MAG: 6-bladed beta-propeller [Acidobacteriota bacterium]
MASILLALLAVVSPADAKGSKKKKIGTAPEESLVWPLPPDAPRVRYLQTLRGATDYKKKQGRWKRFFLGADQARGIELKKPYGVATDREGRVYVTDTGLGAVVVFDPGEREVRLLQGRRSRVRLITPIGVALDARGRVFVSDASLDRVFSFDREGNALLALGADDGLTNPTGLAVDDTRDRLYVADSHRHEIFLYTLDGTFIEKWGGRGSNEGLFNYPTNLALDAKGNLLVVDTGNFRVQTFSPEGEFLSSFGQAGDTYGFFHRPKGIALDSEGHVFVVDAAFSNVQIFNREGEILLFVGSLGRDPGQFWLPAGIHIDGSDRVFVADQINARVQVFQYLRESAAEALSRMLR